MKRRRLKGWVVTLILLINTICLLIFAGESDNFTIFLNSKIIALIIIVINTKILYKYTNVID